MILYYIYYRPEVAGQSFSFFLHMPSSTHNAFVTGLRGA